MVVEQNDQFGADMHHSHLLVRDRREIDFRFCIEAKIDRDRLFAARLHDRYNFERSRVLNRSGVSLSNPDALVHKILPEADPCGPSKN
ncbi:hypothetical protein [Afipia felis]|uniref:hypothetical protein n=1 Tax=Afipia felis TaxID=1035 RepID=UPI0018CD68E1|nr:hypothetical protein [Afipia felis]